MNGLFRTLCFISSMSLAVLSQTGFAQPVLPRPNAAPFSGVPAEFVIKQINGQDSPGEIPDALATRVYLTTFQSTGAAFGTPEEHVQSLARSYELSDEQSLKMRDTLLEVFTQDDARLRAYTRELCSPVMRTMHTSKSIDDFLSYMQSHESELDQQLAADFNAKVQTNLDEITIDKIRSWIRTHTVPSITHMEIDKPRLYKARNVTPASFIASFCNR